MSALSFLGRRTRRARCLTAASVLFVALSAVASVTAAPPANDNRAAAELIATFPATVAGSTVEATVERLDPQVSKCGPAEGTVWYRINQAPDGTVTLGVQGAGLAPVIRVYAVDRSAIRELACGSAGTGKTAQALFRATRGAGYLVLVGRTPGTPDATFTLTASLTLPPGNDSRGQAAPLGKIPATVAGTTVAASYDEDTDSSECGLGKGASVWFSLAPAPGRRVLLRLAAEGEFDAGVAVFERSRSQVEQLGCAKTDRAGRVAVAFDTAKGSTYLIMVGTRAGSLPGAFTLEAAYGEPREKAPGQDLPGAGVSAGVNWISDVNDVYSTVLSAGRTYRIGFSSRCATLTVTGPRKPARTFTCTGYETITPGPESAGRYSFDVSAPEEPGTVAYRLVVRPAEPDDVGAGVRLEAAAPVRGTLTPDLADIVDVYRFVVTTGGSNIRVRLDTRPKSGISMTLQTASGERIASVPREIERALAEGQYVVSVHTAMGERGGAYSLVYAVRQRTRTTIAAPTGELPANVRATIGVAVDPKPDGGWIEIRIERFDQTDGWVFSRALRVKAPSARVPWAPPALGRWRVGARYEGTLGFSPSSTRKSELTVTRARELLPGKRLGIRGVSQTVDWSTDLNDAYWARLEPGATYRVAFSSRCAQLAIAGPRGPLQTVSCNGFVGITPGPDDAGRYTFDVTAPENGERIAYRLVVKAAGPDDTGAGILLENLSVAKGTLDPIEADAVDLYHFSLADEVSDVRIRLSTARASGISISLLTDAGARVGSARTSLHRSLGSGQYVVAVQGAPGTHGGAYALRLAARHLTQTTVSTYATTLTPGATASVNVAVVPRPDAGTVTVRIDRLDPVGGWVFSRRVVLGPSGGSVAWTPGLGRWRVHAAYSGSSLYSASRSGTAQIVVADRPR